MFLFCFSSRIFAGADTDTNYVQTFKNIFALKLFLIDNGFTYSITPQNNSLFSPGQLKNAKVTYNPYIPATAGVSLNIKGIGASYVFKFTNDYLDTTGQAKSAFKQFQMNIYGTKFGFEGYYQDYQRFYYKYKGDDSLSKNLKNYNSDIRAYQFGANAILIFNGKKFSYNAAFNQTVLQKKSAGSWMLTFSLKFNELKARDLIPDDVKVFYGPYTNLQRNRNYAFLLQTGYAFNLTKHHFYFSGALLGGVGIQNQTYLFPDRKNYKIAFPLTGRAKTSLGYNGRIVFTGVFANADVIQSSIKSIKTQQMVSSYGVYLGFRAVQLTKSKGQVKAELRRQKEAEAAAKKKAAADKKAAAKAAKEAKRKKKK
ncbi:MAG: hypothetical protein K0Q95_1983 [Bacteroidota bacterium]|nr:hypothetical protein [Bacteroidota bacterium]